MITTEPLKTIQQLPWAAGGAAAASFEAEPRELRRVKIDESGMPLTPDGYDKTDPFFLEVMSYVLGQPRNLEGRERLQWMYLYRRSQDDPEFLSYMRYRLGNNSQKWHLGGIYGALTNDDTFAQWKAGKFIETQADVDRLREDDRLKSIGKARIEVKRDPVEAFRIRQQEQWTKDPSLPSMSEAASAYWDELEKDESLSDRQRLELSDAFEKAEKLAKGETEP